MSSDVYTATKANICYDQTITEVENFDKYNLLVKTVKIITQIQ